MGLPPRVLGVGGSPTFRPETSRGPILRTLPAQTPNSHPTASLALSHFGYGVHTSDTHTCTHTVYPKLRSTAGTLCPSRSGRNVPVPSRPTSDRASRHKPPELLQRSQCYRRCTESRAWEMGLPHFPVLQGGPARLASGSGCMSRIASIQGEYQENARKRIASPIQTLESVQQGPELNAASYHGNEEEIHQQDGDRQDEFRYRVQRAEAIA